MNRKTLDVMAIFALLTYLEFNHLNLLVLHDEADVIMSLIANLSIMTLLLPCMSMFDRVSERLGKHSANNALVITVSRNHLNGYRLLDGVISKTQCQFSSEQHFIAKQELLKKGLNTTIKELVKGNRVLNLAPYVVIKTDLKSISELEKECLIKCSISAGALKAIVIDLSSNDFEIEESLSSNPVENFV